MTKIHSSMPHLNGNVIAAVDFETTGPRAGYHEPIQIAVVPLNSDLRPLPVLPFYTFIRPIHPGRADPDATRVHGIDIDWLRDNAQTPDKVEDRLVAWWEALDLPFDKVLVPLAHNWAFESSFFNAWLRESLVRKMFSPLPRDAMLVALSENDKAFFRGEPAPFPHVSLTALCTKFKVHNKRPHDALHDSLAEAEVYRGLITTDIY